MLSLTPPHKRARIARNQRALMLRNRKLHLRRRSLSLRPRDGAGAVWGPAVDSVEAEDVGVGVADGVDEHAVMDKGREKRQCGCLLPPPLGGSGREDTSNLADESPTTG
jgi:hypothetical protein